MNGQMIDLELVQYDGHHGLQHGDPAQCIRTNCSEAATSVLFYFILFMPKYIRTFFTGQTSPLFLTLTECTFCFFPLQQFQTGICIPKPLPNRHWLASGRLPEPCYHLTPLDLRIRLMRCKALLKTTYWISFHRVRSPFTLAEPGMVAGMSQNR